MQPPAPNNSFIPKKSPSAPPKRSGRNVIGLFGYISYITFFGCLLATAAVFAYSRGITTELVNAQETLAEVKNEFRQADMNEVQEFERFLNTVNQTFNESFSVNDIFATLEDTIAEEAYIDTLSMDRDGDVIRLSGDIIAESFDAALFQNQVFTNQSLLESLEVNEVSLVTDGVVRTVQDSEGRTTQTVGTLGFGDSDVVRFTMVIPVETANLSFTPRVVPASTDVDDQQEQFDDEEVVNDDIE